MTKYVKLEDANLMVEMVKNKYCLYAKNVGGFGDGFEKVMGLLISDIHDGLSYLTFKQIGIGRKGPIEEIPNEA